MPGSAMREERKVVTALFADTVGATTLGERLDPEDLHELIGEALSRAIEAGEAFGGTVKDLAGDGALILFGAPVSHEDDPERAVRAGLEIVRSIEEYARLLSARGIDGFSMRVGIETGLVVVGPVGGGGRVEYGATGDPVNVAARLQAFAAPGTVVVGPRTYERVAPIFAWGEPRAIDLKGKSEPVAVRVVRAVHRHGRTSHGLAGMSAPLIGRHDELALIRAALLDVGSGVGGVLLVTGDAGVGKSRLVSEARGSASGGVAWLEARSASYAERTPYSVFGDLLADALGATTGEESIERIRAQAGEHEDEVVPFAAVLAGVPDVDPGGRASSLSPASLRRGLVDTVRRVLTTTRAHRPLVVVIEDVHWADPSSLELFGPVVEAATPEGVLFLVTARREPGHPSRAFIDEALARGAQLVQLDTLPAGTDRELLVSLVGPAVVPVKIEEQLLTAAEGNPLYVEELIRSLRDAGALRRVNGGWHLDASVPLEVPPTVEQVILARLDRLSERNRRIVDAACVIGRRFDLELLVAVDGGAPVDVEGSVSSLQQLDIVRWAGAIADDREAHGGAAEYQFGHGLIQETAYRALVRRRRAPLHLRVAQALESRAGRHAGMAGLVGRHYRAAGEPGAALDWLVAAAREAGRAQARDEALHAYDDALDAAGEAGLDPHSAFIAALRIERGGLLARRGAFRGARTVLEAALADVQVSGERGLEGRAEAELGFLLAGTTDYRAALPHLEAALRIAEERGDVAARVTALARLSIVHTNMLRLDLGRELGERALSAARSSADERLLAEALDALKQAALQLGDRSGIEAIADELDAIHRWNDELWLLQFVLLERGYVAVGTARWEEADLRLQEALEISRRIGDRANELLHLSMIAWRDRCLGRHAKALPILENVARRAHEMGHGEWSAWTSLFLGSTLLDLDPEVAAPHFVDAMRSAEEAGAVLHLVRAVGQLAWCSWLLEDRDGAADLAARATSIFADVVCPEGTANLPGADAHLATGRVLVGSGDAERAAALVSPVAEAGRRFGWVEASAGGAIVLGRCSESMGETDMALAQFREAIDIAVGAGMPVLERDARAALSGALAAVDPDEAARQSSRADQITARLRAGIEDARLGAGATLSAPHGSTVE